MRRVEFLTVCAKTIIFSAEIPFPPVKAFEVPRNFSRKVSWSPKAKFLVSEGKSYKINALIAVTAAEFLVDFVENAEFFDRPKGFNKLISLSIAG